MIEGVKIFDRSIISDDRGRIIHMLKSNEGILDEFGEIYCSTIYPRVVKGWHLHTRVTINYTVLKGNIKFVLYDGRDRSSTKNQIQEIILGDSNHIMVSVPPKIWNGFMCIGSEEAFVINIQNKPYNESEVTRVDPHNNNIDYIWKVKDR